MKSSNQIEFEGNFNIRNSKLIIDIGEGLVLTVVLGSFFVPGLFLAVREVVRSSRPSNIYENLLVTGLVVLAALHALMIAIFAFAFGTKVRSAYRMFSMSIDTMNTGIMIVTRTGKCFIDKTEFVHVLGHKNVLQLIWKHNDCPTVFPFRRNLFGKVAFTQMQELVGGWSSYTEDYKDKMAIRRKFRPVDMFSTNRKIWRSYWKNNV